MVERKPNGYWKDFGNIQEELEKIIEKLGHFPTFDELKDLDRHGLIGAISTHGGGINAVRERMGFDYVKKPNRYYESFEKIQEELTSIVERLGHFPTQQELRDINAGLNSGINTYHGGLGKVAQRMGHSSSKKVKGYWKDFGNVEKELEQVIEDLGHFPTTDELKKMGRGDLQGAIAAHHDGINSVRKRMDYEPLRNPDNHYKKFDVMKEELEKVVEKLGHFPSHSELKGMGLGTLSRFITAFPGGIQAVREEMGYDPTMKSGSYWKSLENVQKELKDIIESLGHFPTVDELIKMHRGGLVNAFKYHGGINSVREEMGYDLVKRSNDYWKNFDNLIRELDPIMEEFGHFPTQQELKDIGRGDLISSFKYHGGMNAVRKKLGHDLIQKPRGYWDDFGNLKRELEEVIEEIGHFPSGNELRGMGLGNLEHYVGQYGGMEEVKKRLGYGNTIPDELEEEFVSKIESEKEARKILEEFSDDPKDVADLLRALNPEKFRANTYRILSLSQYLGRFRSGQGDVPDVPDDLIISLDDLIDKNELVREILTRKAFKAYEQKYLLDGGEALEELEQKIADSQGNLQVIYQEVYGDLKDIGSYEIPGATKSLGE